MPQRLTWLVLIAGTALLAGAAVLWLERGHAMLLDLSTGVTAFMCP